MLWNILLCDQSFISPLHVAQFFLEVKLSLVFIRIHTSILKYFWHATIAIEDSQVLLKNVARFARVYTHAQGGCWAKSW